MLATRRTRLTASIAAAAVIGTVGALAATQMALAHNDPPHPTAGTATPSAGGATYLAAVLDGRNEVPVPGGPAVGDPDGQAVELLRVKGNQVSFAIRWTNLGPITAGHIHAGVAGSNGPVQVPFFGTGLSDPSLSATVGTVTVSDVTLLTNLTTNPGGFYANLHTTEFPGGAVRGQLHKLAHAVDLTAVLRGGPLAGLLSGDQEVPGTAPVGDPDGHASAFVGAHDGTLDYAFTWSGIAAPTNGHIHEGTVGVNGPVVAPLFAAPTGLPASVSGVAGTVRGVAPDLLRRISLHPNGFYANLHTGEFSGGAVRGQLFRTGQSSDTAFDQSAFVAPVVRGEQIYACTKQADGSYAFTQHNVSAVLQGGIAHSFVKNDAGPPQWVARDGSAVTGAVVTKTPNGTGNIAELDLNATQAGAPTGLLAGTVEILRLNTVGGVAPAGTCDPATRPIAKVPYRADYLFIQG
jgi:CHRD domain-containing protein/uncharacterized protein DUF3455